MTYEVIVLLKCNEIEFAAACHSQQHVLQVFLIRRGHVLKFSCLVQLKCATFTPVFFAEKARLLSPLKWLYKFWCLMCQCKALSKGIYHENL